MVNVAIVYHSGFGHTAKVADYVAKGARSASNTQVVLINVEAMTETAWETLDTADAIIFGSPTYMGGVSAQFKAFIDATSKRWFTQAWKNKIAAGFTNAGSLDGDKLSTLKQLALNAMQHGMIWVGTGIMPGSSKLGDQALNRLGSFLGLMTQSGNDSPDVTPPKGDLDTAELFGKRIADIAAKHKI